MTHSSIVHLGKLDELCEELEETAQHMEQAAKILREQITHRNRIWLKAAKETVGNSVSTFVGDIANIERHGRKRATTWPWAEGKSKKEKRRAKMAMGYMLSSCD